MLKNLAFLPRYTSARIRAGVLMLMLVASVQASAQLYLDAVAHYDFYQFDKPLQIENSKVNFMPRLGVVVYNNSEKTFRVAVEASFFNRKFHQIFPEEDFQYRFLGVSLSGLASYKVSEKLSLDAGLQFILYESRITGYSIFTEVGDGFRGHDIGIIMGTSYYFTDMIGIGVRYTPYLFRMLEYQRIDDYGAFEPSKKDISTQRLALYVRFQFLNSMSQ